MKKSVLKILCALVMTALSTVTTFATTGTWNVDAAGNWSVVGNWSGGVPSAAGDTANLTFDITAARAVTLDAAETVGTLNIGDPASPFFGYTLSGTSALTFDNSGSGALLNQATVGGAVDAISAPLSLADNLTISNVNGLTLSGIISSSGSVALTKNGVGGLIISGVNTFTANNIFVNAGTLYMPRSGANNGATSALGNVLGGGMNIYINPGATLSSGNNNWFGNATLADSSLPTFNITGGTLVITNNYTTIGALNLTNGATVTSTGTGGGNYYGFQLRGNVIVGGTSPSTISGSRDYHLNVNTTFDVENTGGSPADLTVSANLRNLSGDFGNAVGSFTKNGPGKMMLTGAANVFSGSATINAGILQIGDGTANNGSMAAYIDDEAVLIFANPTAWTYTNYIVGAGDLIKTGAGTLTLSGTSYYTGSTVISNGVVNFSSPQSISGSITVNDGSALAVSASTDANHLSPSSLTVGNSTGGTLQFSLGGSITGPNANTLLEPGSLTLNGITAIVISHCPQSVGSYPLFNGYDGASPLTLASQPAGVLGEITASGGVVYYQVTNTVTDVWTSQVDTNWDTVTANWTNNLQVTTYSQGDPVQFDDTANGTSPLMVNIVSSISPNAITVSNVSKAYVIGGQAVSGVTGLTKTGSNALTLTGTNTFTGDLAILGGTLAIGNGGGGQLGAGAFAGNIDDEALLQYSSSNAQTLSGIISGPGALVVTNGTLTLNGANTYNGGTTLSNGTVVFGNGNALGAGAVTTTGGTLKWSYVSGNTILTNNLAVNGPTTLDVASGNWTMNGNLTGSGAITRGTAATLSLYLGGDNGGFTGTFTVPANGNAVVRFNSATAGSANARWVFNQNVSGRLSLFSGTMNFGSMTGSGFVQQATTGTTTLQAGALGLNDVFSGVMQQANAGDILVFSKVGTGRMTLSGANTYAGGTIISNGVLCVSNSAALSTSGNITFGGGTLQYSGVNGADYSSRIANSTAPISIDLQGTNVTYAFALPSSNTGGLALTNSAAAGTNKLTLAAAEAYTGSTMINGGTLALSGSGAINFSTNIIVAGGGTFDVSRVSYTLGGNQTLAGNGVVTGAVTTAASGSTISPGGAGTVGTLAFQGNVNLSSGATPTFDVSTSHSSGNDQIVVSGNLALGASDTIHVNALGGSSPLDETADYVLFSVTGTTTMASQPLLVFDNTPPSDASHYSIQTSGNNVVLRYSASAAPVVTSVVITNTADGSTVGVRGQSATIYVTAQPGSGTLGAGSVTADLSSLGGSSTQVLNYLGGNNWSYTIVLGQGAVVGTDSVGVTATDSLSASGSGVGTFTVNASSLTWNGSGTDANWGTGGNWVGAIPPGFGGDSVTFTGSVNTSPNLEADYSVAGMTFDASASSFTNGSTTGKTLTLAGPVSNSSSNPQFFNLAVAMIGSPTITDSGAGITFAGGISGFGLEISNGIVTLAGADTYTADTVIDSGATLKVGNSAALPYGSAVGGNASVAGTLDINGTNAAVNGLSGSGIVDNTSAGPATLSLGNGDVSSTFAGVVQDTGANLALLKTGLGTLTLSGANTYNGGTTLSNGTLIVHNNGALGSGMVTLAGGTIQGNVTVNNTFFAVTNSTTTLDVQGGNFTINGNFTGGGTIMRSAGVTPPLSLFLGGDNSGFTGIFQDQNSANSVVRFTANTAGSASARWIFNQPTLGRTSLPGVSGTIRFGSLSGSGTLSDGGNGIANTIEVGALGLNDTFSGVIGQFTGTVGLTKVGTGTLTLSGANNYTGPTVVSSGTLNVSSAKVSTGDFTVADGATLGVNLATDGASLKMTSLTLGAGSGCTNSFTGISSQTVPAITNSGAFTLNGTVTVNVWGNIAVGQYPLIASAGGITGSGGFTVGILPAGAVATIITNSNVIVLNVTTAPPVQIWTGSTSSNWDKVATNWTLGNTPAIYSDNDPAQFDDSSAVTNVTLVTNVSPLALIITNNTRDYTIVASGNSKITGATSVSKSGVGKLTLVGMSNDFTGGFSINGGTVVASDSANLGAGTVMLSGTLSPSQSFTLARTVNVGPATGTGFGIYDIASGLTLTNTTAMGNNGSGTGTLIKTGSGTLQLGGNSTYSGGTMVSNGTLVLTAGGGAGTIRGALTIEPGASVKCTAVDALGYSGGQSVTPVNINGGILDDISGGNEGYITTYNLMGGLMTNSVATDGTHGFNFNGSSSGLNSLATNIVSIVSGNMVLRSAGLHINTAQGTVPGGIDLTISGIISGGYGFQKDGAGTLELTGANIYTGTTTVANGGLLVDGAGVMPGAVNVNSGAVFGGNGSVNGAVTVSAGGTLAPGTSAGGTLTVTGNLTLNAGSTSTFAVDGSAPDNTAVAVGGAVAYGGTLNIVPAGTFSLGQQFILFNGSNATNASNFAGISGSPGSGLAFSFANGVLSVVSAGPSGSATITNSVSGNTLSLSWPAGQGWKLQVQTNSLTAGLGTNWTYITDGSVSSTNITMDPTKPTAFYRLVNP